MEKKVSIIIPAYNCEKTIEKCLNSILQQTYYNIEVIVLNDGSTDNTAEVLEKYKRLDKRIVVIHKENTGVSDTRNLGIKKSTGSYISFIDSDDWIEINMIEKMVETIEKQEVQVVRCNYFLNHINGKQKKANMYELTNKRFKRDEIYNQGVIEHFLLGEKEIANFVMLLLIKKEVLVSNTIYFEKNLYIMEDVYFYQKIFNNVESIYFLDEPLYHYYENANSVTRAKDKLVKNIYGIIQANTELTRYIKENNIISINVLQLNITHLFTIYTRINRLCIEMNKTEIIELLHILHDNSEYNRILNNIEWSSINMAKKIRVGILKCKNRNIQYWGIKIISIFWKIKNEKKGNNR